MSATLNTRLEVLKACPQALTWSERFGEDCETAWNTCERGDWMLWLVTELGHPEALEAEEQEYQRVQSNAENLYEKSTLPVKQDYQGVLISTQDIWESTGAVYEDLGKLRREAWDKYQECINALVLDYEKTMDIARRMCAENIRQQVTFGQVRRWFNLRVPWLLDGEITSILIP